MKKTILTTLNAIALIMVGLYVSVHIPTFSMATYENHYRMAGTAELIQISQEDLMNVTNRLVGYMAGTYDDIIIYATVAGEYRQFFNQLEIVHMVDVRVLFEIGGIFRNIFIVIGVATLAWVIKTKNYDALFKSYFYSGAVTLLTILALVLLIFSDFQRYFILFHEIFFFNDYWILDPRTDLLINLVPEIFFINIFRTISTIFLGGLVALTIGSGVVVYKRRSTIRT